jgi:hypothetical protein
MTQGHDRSGLTLTTLPSSGRVQPQRPLLRRHPPSCRFGNSHRTARARSAESFTAAEAVVLHTPITRPGKDAERQDVFDWTTTDPPLNAPYRLEWRFRGRSDGEPVTEPRLASDRMKAAVIIQPGGSILNQATRPFNLSAEAAQAAKVIDQLIAECNASAKKTCSAKAWAWPRPRPPSTGPSPSSRCPTPTPEPLVLSTPAHRRVQRCRRAASRHSTAMGNTASSAPAVRSQRLPGGTVGPFRWTIPPTMGRLPLPVRFYRAGHSQLC